MISIYTHTTNPFKPEFWRHAVRKALGKYSGPDAVADSLARGLTELGVIFEMNPRRPSGDIVHVLSGIEALRDAIELKRTGKIKLIVAGPALVVNPDEHDSLIASPEIDLILQPSDWVKSYFVHKNAALESRIRTWAAGSQVPETKSGRSGPLIIYSKNFETGSIPQIQSILSDQGHTSEVITYGTFTRQEFYKKLETAQALIYLSKSESQSIALQEAWLRDVPTLVLKSGEMRYGNDTWNDPKINAPYLTPGLGRFFALSELAGMIDEIRHIHPREEAAMKFSDIASARQYLEILNERTD